MAAPVLVQLWKWLHQKTTMNNGWFRDDLYEIYVRKARRMLTKPGTNKKELMDCLDVGNINVFKPSEKLFTEVILPGLKIMMTRLTAERMSKENPSPIQSDFEPMPIVWENVHNVRLYKFLREHDATKIVFEGEDPKQSKHCIWWPCTSKVTIWCNDYCVPMNDNECLKGEPDCGLGCWILGKDDLFDLCFRHENLHKYGLMICVDGVPIFTYKRGGRDK